MMFKRMLMQVHQRIRRQSHEHASLDASGGAVFSYR
jgi:hypothetical protein